MCVKWKRDAEKQLKEALLYIQNDSPSNAEKIRNEIFLKISDLLRNPEAYPADKYKVQNDGSFRAFELYHYRISCRVKSNEIRILRVRHTGMNPKTW